MVFNKVLLRFSKNYSKQISASIISLIVSAIAILYLGSVFRSHQNTHILILFVSVILGSSSFFRYYITYSVIEKIMIDIREQILVKITECDTSYFRQNHPSKVVHSIISNTKKCIEIIGGKISFMVRNGIVAFVSIFMMFYINIQLALLSFLGILLGTFPLFIISKKLKDGSVQSSKTFDQVGVCIAETVNNIKQVKYFGLHAFILQNLKICESSYFSTVKKYSKVKGVMLGLLTFSLINVINLFWYIDGNVLQMPKADLFTFIFYAFLCAGAVTGLGDVYTDMQKLNIALESLNAYLNIPEEIKVGSISDFDISSLSFRDVSFGYKDDVKVLDNVSFDLEKGNFVILSGKLGAGKTTVFDIISRFFIPSEGQVLINQNINLNNLDLKVWRSKCIVVEQNPILFSGTIEDNITLFKDFHEERVNLILKITELDEWIHSLPNGLSTYIGHFGSEVSGGQKQKIAIARALLMDPQLLLLDEVTSSLDDDTSHRIFTAIKTYMKDKLVFAIVHRQDLFVFADQIIKI